MSYKTYTVMTAEAFQAWNKIKVEMVTENDSWVRFDVTNYSFEEDERDGVLITKWHYEPVTRTRFVPATGKNVYFHKTGDIAKLADVDLSNPALAKAQVVSALFDSDDRQTGFIDGENVVTENGDEISIFEIVESDIDGIDLVGDSCYSVNSGYVGYSMSKRAKAAYEAGEQPKSKWTKSAMLQAIKAWENESGKTVKTDLGKLKKTDLFDTFFYSSSWHHTSKNFNLTEFYALNKKAVLAAC